MLVKCPDFNKDDEECFGCTHNRVHEKNGDCLRSFWCGRNCKEVTPAELANFNYNYKKPHCPYCGTQQEIQISDTFQCCDCGRGWVEHYKFSHIELETQ